MRVTGLFLRACCTAARMDPAAVMWFSLIRMPSYSPTRWFCPPPTRTAYFSLIDRELRGAPELIHRLAAQGVRVSLGHSAATVSESRAGYAAGAVTTTHLFNAMSGVVHREPGLAVAALLDDSVWVELIADTLHVDPDVWPLIWRLKPAERVLLVSDAIALAGSGVTHGMLGALEVRVDGEKVTLVDGGNLAGSVTALDLELRHVVRAGVPLVDAVRAVAGNPAELLGLTDRGRLAPGLRADIVVLDADTFAVRRVMSGGEWIV